MRTLTTNFFSFFSFSRALKKSILLFFKEGSLLLGVMYDKGQLVNRLSVSIKREILSGNWIIKFGHNWLRP